MRQFFETKQANELKPGDKYQHDPHTLATIESVSNGNTRVGITPVDGLGFIVPFDTCFTVLVQDPLIAAAPDLLDTLEQVRRDMAECGGFLSDDTRKAVREAIRKAKGGS